MSRVAYETRLIALILTFFLSGCQSADNPETDNARAGIAPVPEIELTSVELSWIGAQVFRNECAAKEACLVHWNEGEAFPSLGIGHFIWYPGDVNGPFVESFPAMIEYLSDQGSVLPDWLAKLDPFDAPWANREVFLEASEGEPVRELRSFLASTKGHQVGFLVQRAREALGRIVASVPESGREALSRRLEALTRTPGGVYAVIDYVNFKGEGLAVTERYDGQGWGLLQVLQGVSEGQNKTALQAFRESAARVLTRRAENADKPIERERWLPGWLNRLKTYREPE
jgi:hypothetical protein